MAKINAKFKFSFSRSNIPVDPDRVLIGVVRRQSDLQIFLAKRWYRIPARQTFNFAPRYLSLYQTKKCGPAGGAITSYASIKRISLHRRKQLLPRDKNHPRAEEWYWQLHLGSIHTLPHRIENRLRRRITFAYTTLDRLYQAREIGELFDVPLLEEVMMKALKKSHLRYTPQFCVMNQKKCRYRLDFAIFCTTGEIALECDYSKWHNQLQQRKRDKIRDSWLHRNGWTVLHFSEDDILKHRRETIRHITDRIIELGGIKKLQLATKTRRHQKIIGK